MGKDTSPHVLANCCLRSRRIFPYLATYHYSWRFLYLLGMEGHIKQTPVWSNETIAVLYKSVKILLIEFSFLLLNSNNIYFIDAMREKKKEQTFQALCY